jgi:hypothetical protein
MAGKGALRRLTGTMGLLILSGGFFALALSLLTQGLEKSSQWLSILGGVLAIAAVTRQPVRILSVWLRHGSVPSQLEVEDAVEELAQSLDEEWTEEEERRRASNPESLPVRWTVTAAAESAMAGVDWADLVAGGGAVGPQLLAGEYAAIHETFTQRLPHRRLVILGRAGGGKSSLARRLARDLLCRRAIGDRVPVFLPLASWDPGEDLYAWVARRLIRDHPPLEALSPGPLGRPPVPLSTELVKHRRLLFVLDGFDEIPEASRKPALAGINNLGAEVPVVVTSRTGEYQQAVLDFGRGLSRAAAVELSPVDGPAIKGYLARNTSAVPPGRWDAVFALLDRANGSAVTQALRIPLLIWLARVVYEDKVSVPDELAAFADPAAVEIHLLDGLIAAAYTSAGGRQDGRWGAAQARRWLGFLARWLQHHRTADLAWWQLRTAAPRTVDRLATGLPVGLAAGVPAGIIMGTMTGLFTGLATTVAFTALATARASSRALVFSGRRLPGPIIGRTVALAAGLGIGLPMVLRGELAAGVAQGTSAGMLAGLAAGFLVYEARLKPTRVILHIRGNRMRFLRRVVVGLLIGLVFGAVLGAVLGLLNGSATGLVFGVVSLGMGLALGIIDGLHIWIDSPAQLPQAISPETVLRDDRAASLVRALVAGPLVAAGAGLTAAFAYGPATGAGLGCLMAFAYTLTDRMVGMTSTSWGSFTLVRAWLALRGELPWRLMAFLDDAHNRGVLRRSGAVHQFRHARLQERLAAAVSERRR